MKVGTLSIVVGSRACNAACPFCVSAMTPEQGVRGAQSGDYFRNLDKAVLYARDCGVSTALVTGKGEPTLELEWISAVLQGVGNVFPFVELQTNGLRLQDEAFTPVLAGWHKCGLNMICLSITHYNDHVHSKLVDSGQVLEIWKLVDRLHTLGFSVRLSALLIQGYLDTDGSVSTLVRLARTAKVEQLTIRELSVPEVQVGPDGAMDRSTDIRRWVLEHSLTKRVSDEITKWVETVGTPLLDLPHGARVFDADGQNVCISTCLTSSTDPEDQRQLIYFPDGHLRYDWTYEGAILF